VKKIWDEWDLREGCQSGDNVSVSILFTTDSYPPTSDVTAAKIHEKVCRLSTWIRTTTSTGPSSSCI